MLPHATQSTPLLTDAESLLAERAATEDHAPGELSLFGGTVERDAGRPAMASTVRRELREEAGVELGDLAYVTSGTFETDGGGRCVNVVFLARHDRGEPVVREPKELADVGWFSPADATSHPAAAASTRAYVEAAERRRRSLCW